MMSAPLEILNRTEKSSWQFPTSAFYREMLRGDKENVGKKDMLEFWCLTEH